MARFSVRVQPGARSDEIVGWTSTPEGDETLKIRLRAAPVEGKANAALIDFLAESLGLRPRQITIERGEKSREKIVSTEGLTLEDVKRKTTR